MQTFVIKPVVSHYDVAGLDVRFSFLLYTIYHRVPGPFYGQISYRNSYLGLGIFCGISDPDEIRALFAIAMEREPEEVIGEIESVPLS